MLSMNAFQDKLAAALAAVPSPLSLSSPIFLLSFCLALQLMPCISAYFFLLPSFHSFWGLYTVSISHFLFFSPVELSMSSYLGFSLPHVFWVFFNSFSLCVPFRVHTHTEAPATC